MSRTKLHLAVDPHGMLLWTLITEDITVDETQALALFDGFAAENLLEDKDYNADTTLALTPPPNGSTHSSKGE